VTVRALTFDVDGTLYDSRRVRWRFALANLRGMRTVRVAMRVREALRAEAFASGEALLAQQAATVAERVADGRTAEAVRADVEELLGPRLCRTIARVGPRPDAREALEAAVSAGLLLGAVSDYPVDDKLEAMGLADLPWQARIAADSLGALKPHARAYEAAAAALGVPSAEICHIGDRLDTDVRAARGAGFQTVLLGPPHPDVVCVPTLLAAVKTVLGEG